MNHSDTIYALASAHGKAGVAVFRISGAHARQALISLGVDNPLTPRMATLVTLRSSGTPLDTALALFFPTPHSFTGDDVLELHTHGSRATTQLLLAALAQIPGLRLAEPGEFARRAFLNGKFDLLEAEGLADLIEADTPAQHAQAMRQLGGEMSARITALREQILHPLALLEAYIDFPEEEIPESVLGETTLRVEALQKEMQALIHDNGIGEKIRDGVEIVIFGAPNAGKSSLLNAIARRDVAIVSPEAGTTRDLIEVQVNLGGYAATLVDTAGLRNAEGLVEAEGIRRAQQRIEQADFKLALVDINSDPKSITETLELVDKNTLVIYTKSDQNSEDRKIPSLRAQRRNPENNASGSEHWIATSAPPPHNDELLATPHHISTVTGDGVEALLAALKAEISQRLQASSPVITRARHREAILAALSALTRFSTQHPLELMCEELRVAATQIGKITGKITTDDLLDVVFSRFCIGK